MKRILSLFSLLLMAAVQMWAGLPVSYEYVDLGLSVKWATCNLGATSPTDAGLHLAWGETLTKSKYDWNTYLSDLGGTMTQLQDAGTDKDPLKEYVKGGANYSEGIGGTAYDAATAVLGAGYRMPTLEEFAELANTDNCSWVWYDEDNTEFNGVAGYKVTSKKDGYTGNSIFIPAAGARNVENLNYEGSCGYFWSSTPDSGEAYNANFLYFSSDYIRPFDYDARFLGFTIRPVYAPAPIARIGETIYTDVDEFIDAYYAIEGTASVKLLGDIILPEEDFLGKKNGNANITLDLNGHNITGNRHENAVIIVSGKLTISGEGVVENTGEKGDVVGSEGYVEINGGTYIGKADICYCFSEGVLFINGGKFNAPTLYYNDDDYYSAPTVKGGLFSMDPSVGVTVGYEVVDNDDEETKDVYPFMVVESDVDLTHPAGLLAVPQAGELNVRAYFTTMPGMPYMYALIRGEYHSLKEAKENSKEEDFVYSTPIPQNATAPLQSINIKDSSKELEDGETYTLVVLTQNILDIEDEPVMELAVIAFQVGEGEIAPESILVEAGKLNTSASFSVSDEDLEAGAAYSYLLFEGRITNFVQAMIMAEALHALPVYVSQVPVAIESNDVEITLSSDEVELVAGKEYTLVIYDSMRRIIPEIGIPLFYDFIHYKAVEKNTETAIDAIDANKSQKAIKTIENGKVVIIRGDEKWDLNGKKVMVK